ncbi:MAG: RidA family protein [Betaproteobacteria bacterium]|nr:RidA family protein [Betaproteobacteria bacterium]
MPGITEKRLADLDISLPAPAPSEGNYIPTVTVGSLVFVAGQVTRSRGKLEFVGKLGREFDVDEGQKAARLCATNVLAQLKEACGGDLDRVVRCVRVTGYVNCMPEFTQQPQVINGASDFFVAVFEKNGRHARTAIGVSSLPGGVACEVEAIFQIR